jgi:hypothetical protein
MKDTISAMETKPTNWYRDTTHRPLPLQNNHVPWHLPTNFQTFYFFKMQAAHNFNQTKLKHDLLYISLKKCKC